MRMTLTSLIWMASFPALVTAGPATNDIGSVAVTVSGVEVQARVSDDGGHLTLSIDGKGSVPVKLPETERVSEIRLARWMNSGVALAVETHNSKSNEFSYFWSTVLVNPQGLQIGTPVVNRFLESKIDYDIVGVVNSQSDSIYVTLLRHHRGNELQYLDGYVYINNCPVGPGAKGILLPLKVSSQAVENER